MQSLPQITERTSTVPGQESSAQHAAPNFVQPTEVRQNNLSICNICLFQRRCKLPFICHSSEQTFMMISSHPCLVRVGKIWRACDSPSRKNSTSHLFWLVQTCSNHFTPVHTHMHVHTCSHLFTPQWLSTLCAQWQFPIEFSLCESCYFSILRPILLKLNNLAHLIKSFPTVYALCSCSKT